MTEDSEFARAYALPGTVTAERDSAREERDTALRERDEARKQLDGRLQWQAEAALNLQTFRALFDAACLMREDAGCSRHDIEPPCGECNGCTFIKAVDQAKAEVAAGVDEFIQESLGYWGRFAAKMQKERDEARADVDRMREWLATPCETEVIWHNNGRGPRVVFECGSEDYVVTAERAKSLGAALLRAAMEALSPTAASNGDPNA